MKTRIPCYALIWQSPTMPAPAFWYWTTRRQAETARRTLQPGTRATIARRTLARITDHAPRT